MSRRRARPGVAPRRAGGSFQSGDATSNKPNRAAPQDGWLPITLEPFISFDLRELDPASGVPRAAHKRWLKRVGAGRLKCVACWEPLKFATPRHPIVLGMVRFPTAVSLMALCASCAFQNHPDQAGAVLYEAVLGEHGADRVFTHRLGAA